MDKKIKAMIEILELEDYDLIHKNYYDRFSLIDALKVIEYLHCPDPTLRRILKTRRTSRIRR